MTRTEVEDRLMYCKREHDMLAAVHADMGCRKCWHYAAPVCKKHGPVPTEFVEKGCDEWDYNDCPF